MAPNGCRKITSTNDFAEKVDFVSILLFQCMNDVMKTGNQRALEESDFEPLSNEDTSQSVTVRLAKKWKEEKAYCTRKEKRPRLWKSVLKTLSLREAAYVYLPGVLYGIGSLVTPLLIGYLIFMLMSPGTHTNPILHGCLLAAAMTINTLIGSLAMQHRGYACEILGIRLSNAIKGLVYRKVSTGMAADSSLTTSTSVFGILHRDTQNAKSEEILFSLGTDRK